MLKSPKSSGLPEVGDGEGGVERTGDGRKLKKLPPTSTEGLLSPPGDAGDFVTVRAFVPRSSPSRPVLEPKNWKEPSLGLCSGFGEGEDEEDRAFRRAYVFRSSPSLFMFTGPSRVPQNRNNLGRKVSSGAWPLTGKQVSVYRRFHARCRQDLDPLRLSHQQTKANAAAKLLRLSILYSHRSPTSPFFPRRLNVSDSF